MVDIAIAHYVNIVLFVLPHQFKNKFLICNIVYIFFRDINKEIDSTPTQHDIKDLRKEMDRMRESLIQEIQKLDIRQPVLALDNPRR